MKKNLFLFALSAFFITANAQHIAFNKLWQTNNASPGSNEQIGCALNSNGNFVYFTNHNPGGNCNMSLNFLSSNGTLGWQNSCNSCPVLNDIGSDVAIDNLGNIYACGAKGNGTNLDYYITKISPSGSVIWSQIYNGTGNNDDVPSDIELDQFNNIYVTGTSYGVGLAMTDIVTIKFNNAGVQQWVKRYNAGNLPEVGIALKIDNSNNVFVCGSAATNMSNADFIVLKYDFSTGNQIALNQHPSVGTGLDLPSEMVIDNNNNIFIVGTSVNGSNKNIKTLALTNSLATLWSAYVDNSGNNDEGYGILVNSNADVVITGYCQKANNGTDLIAIKYNSSNGNVINSYKKAAKIDNDIAKGRKIKKAPNGKLIIAGEIQEGAIRNAYVIALDQNLNSVWEKHLNNGNGNNSARNLIIDNDNIYVNGISDNGVSKQVTTAKISIEDANSNAIMANGAKLVDDELIIQFDRRNVTQTLFATKDIQYGALSDFVPFSVILKMDSIYPIEGGWRFAKARKMFLNMTNADTISLSREGIFVDIKNLYPTLVVTVPLSDEKGAGDSLSKFYPIIRYAEANYYGEYDAVNPNDPQYTGGNQSGLTNATHGINLPAAWNLSIGSPNVKIGVFDSGINYFHEDFGNGTFSGSKIVDGKDFSTNAHISTFTTPDGLGHGTGVAGIIGALSNNGKGIAGITGGDGSISNKGCPLYAMKIGDNSSLYPTNIAAGAIVEGSVYNPQTNYGFGLHVQNHSWSTFVPTNALAQAVSTAYNNSSSFVASSGNFPANNCATQNCVLYPASYADATVLKVGASDGTGQQAAFSVEDNAVDFVAPGTDPIYASLHNTINNDYSFSGDGTSFAAPHVTGLVGLMMSVHNTTMGAPCQLAPEDVQYLIKKSCTDVGTPGYDIGNGEGRINAGLTVQKIYYPKYQIKHPAITTNAVTVGPSNQQILLLHSYDNLAAGSYFATRHQVTWAYSEVFPQTATVLDWWNRPSSEVGFNGANPVNPVTDVQYFPIVTGPNIFIGNATAFCYNVTSNLAAQQFNVWIPAQPSQLRAAFSVYAYDAAAVGVKEEQNDEANFNLYPNPTNDIITVNYGDNSQENLTLEVTDVLGNVIVKTPYKTMGADGITINLSHLKTGVYFCKVYSSTFSFSRKFIKL